MKVIVEGSVFEPVYNTLQEVFPLSVKYGYKYHIQLYQSIFRPRPFRNKADKYAYLKLCWEM